MPLLKYLFGFLGLVANQMYSGIINWRVGVRFAILALLITTTFALGDIAMVSADAPRQTPGDAFQRNEYDYYDVRRDQGLESSRDAIGRSLFNQGNALEGPRGGSTEAIAREFLADRNNELALLRSGETAPVFVLEQEFRIGNSGLTHLVFRETYNGIAVFGGHVQVHVMDDGSILRANLPAPVRFPSSGIPIGVTAADALRLAEDALGISDNNPSNVVLDSPIPNALTRDYREQLPSPKQVYFSLSTHSELAWELFLPVLSEDKMYHMVVSAEDGRLLFSRNLVVDTEPEGNVFRAPRSDSSSDAGVPDPDAGARTVEPFTGYPASDGDCSAPIYSGGTDCWTTFQGSPLNSYFTTGNNVFSGYPDGSSVTTDCSDPVGHLNFPFTNSYETSGDFVSDRCAAVANLFYWTNVAHDWFYDLGFNEAAGNFQFDNFSRGGVGNDDVIAVAQFGLNNASFATFPDGNAPFMLMGLFDSPRRADSAFDSDVIIHEYGHGVTNRMVGGAADANALTFWQSGGLGEGWSDVFAFSLMDDPVMGEYITGNSTSGIRRHPYDNSPWTFGDFGNIFQGLLNGGFPIGLPEVHDDGEIWAATLYDVRQTMISADPSNGKENFEKLIITALALTPSRPSMLDARDAILQAASLSNSGTTACSIWEPFANRGFGNSAELNHVQSVSPNDTALSVYEAFDTPPTCGGVALVSGSSVFSDNMESGTNGWTSDGLWHQSARRANSGPTSWYFGQESDGTYNTGNTEFG